MGAPTLIQWGVATRALPGETESGDRYVVRPGEAGVLVAVADGLGHGAEAALAAGRAVTLLEHHADESLVPLVERCHRALASTRGVVLSLALFNDARSSVSWLGVGNVAALLVRADSAARPARVSLVTPGGIVGSALPRLTPRVLALAPGDTVIFATDGIAGGFADDLAREESPQELADHILARHAMGTDDALVLVARWRGRDGGDGAGVRA